MRHDPLKAFYSLNDLAGLFREHRTTVWRKVRRRVYPAPVYIVPGRPLFPCDEIDALIDRAKAVSDPTDPPARCWNECGDPARWFPRGP